MAEPIGTCPNCNRPVFGTERRCFCGFDLRATIAGWQRQREELAELERTTAEAAERSRLAAEEAARQQQAEAERLRAAEAAALADAATSPPEADAQASREEREQAAAKARAEAEAQHRREAEAERQRAAAEAQAAAEAEAQRQRDEAAEAERVAAKAEAEAEALRRREEAAARERAAAKAAADAEAQRQHDAAETQAAADAEAQRQRDAEAERQRTAAKAAAEAETQRQRDAATARERAAKAEEQRQRDAEAERQRTAAKAAAEAEAQRRGDATAAREQAAKAEEQRRRDAEAERQRSAAKAAADAEAQLADVEARLLAQQRADAERRKPGPPTPTPGFWSGLLRLRTLLMAGGAAMAMLGGLFAWLHWGDDTPPPATGVPVATRSGTVLGQLRGLPRVEPGSPTPYAVVATGQQGKLVQHPLATLHLGPGRAVSDLAPDRFAQLPAAQAPLATSFDLPGFLASQPAASLVEERAAQLAVAGDWALARLLLRWAIEENPRAGTALGRLYDPNFVAGYRTPFRPDPGRAMAMYERAATAGDAEATRLLGALRAQQPQQQAQAPSQQQTPPPPLPPSPQPQQPPAPPQQPTSPPQPQQQQPQQPTSPPQPQQQQPQQQPPPPPPQQRTQQQQPQPKLDPPAVQPPLPAPEAPAEVARATIAKGATLGLEISRGWHRAEALQLLITGVRTESGGDPSLAANLPAYQARLGTEMAALNQQLTAYLGTLRELQAMPPELLQRQAQAVKADPAYAGAPMAQATDTLLAQARDLRDQPSPDRQRVLQGIVQNQ